VKAIRWYVFGVLIALDQVANALFGGYPDETVSFRSARARDRGERWGCILCGLLDVVHRNHCDLALRSKSASLLRRSAR
jgi:hypothetical protein